MYRCALSWLWWAGFLRKVTAVFIVGGRASYRVPWNSLAVVMSWLLVVDLCIPRCWLWAGFLRRVFALRCTSNVCSPPWLVLCVVLCCEAGICAVCVVCLVCCCMLNIWCVVCVRCVLWRPVWCVVFGVFVFIFSPGLELFTPLFGDRDVNLKRAIQSIPLLRRSLCLPGSAFSYR